MEFYEEDLKTIIEALSKASNFSETEWLNMEKMMLENGLPSSNENVNTHIREMWNRLNLKIEDSIDRMKMQK